MVYVCLCCYSWGVGSDGLIGSDLEISFVECYICGS